MLDVIATSLAIHLGKKAIDYFWSRAIRGEHPIVDQAGQSGTAPMTSGRPVISPADLHRSTPPEVNWPPPRSPWPPAAPPQHAPIDPYWAPPPPAQRLEAVTVNVFLHPEADYLRHQNTVSASLIVSAEHEEVLLAAVDLAQPFEVDLVPGNYFFYTLVLDPSAAGLLDSYTFALGFPATVNLQDFDSLTVGDFEDLLEMTSEEPVYVAPDNGPYTLDMILLPLDELGIATGADRRLATVLGLSGY
jgi:hypothetical protein